MYDLLPPLNIPLNKPTLLEFTFTTHFSRVKINAALLQFTPSFDNNNGF